MTATRDDIPTTYVTEDQWAWRTPHQWRYEFADNPSPALDRSKLLDRPSERHPLLDALFDLALTRLLLTADGATMQLKVRINGGGSSSSTAPVSSLSREMDWFGEQYTRAKTHRVRLQVIKDTQEAYMIITHSRKANPALVRGTQEWRETIARDTRPRRIVAHDFHCSSKTITAAKREFGVS